LPQAASQLCEPASQATPADTKYCWLLLLPLLLDAGSAVLFLADGNGEFTKAMGLELDGSGFGLGSRSQRYAAVIEDGTVRAVGYMVYA
jgi:hypothetical protein